MSDREQLLEATLDLIDEGIAVLDQDASVVFWNEAAAALTGYRAEDVVQHPCPPLLYRVESDRLHLLDAGGDEAPESPTLVTMLHRLGHTVPGMLRKVGLQDRSGVPTGAALLFYPVDEADALPRGECGEDRGIERSQTAMEERLDAAHYQWTVGRMPFGLLWVTVDQAQSLRTTHGRDACESMLQTIEQTLLRQMKPAEVIGRWGCNEFLILTHERTADLLRERARRLAGLTRTADFRWWGDRIGLTVSIGASQATGANTLQSILLAARKAMQASAYAGGNQVTEARGR
jgi:diguanylate cyclase (GGDEF)-like protein/PAS domain S-box-containing protein